VLAAALAYGAFYAPSMSLISDGAERAGLAQGLAFGLMNAWWATGNAIGPAVGGALGELAGDAVPFVLCAALCLATYVAARPRVRAQPAYEISSSRLPSGSRK
jgi:MFS family permease